MDRRSLRFLLVLVLALASLGMLAGCDNPTANVEQCATPGAEVVEAIQQELSVPGKLRNAKMVPDARYTFISAELHPPDVDRHDEGDILTWATRDLEGSEFVSVDVHARESSSWPHASFDVRERGAIESRACTNFNRGKTRAQIECEQDQAQSGAGLPNGVDCSDR